MHLARHVKRTVLTALATAKGDAAGAIAASGHFDVADIGGVCDSYYGRTASAPPWHLLRDSHLRLPEWFRHGLDPWGQEYAAQQERLWRAMSGVERAYIAETDEREHDWSHADPVRTPGYFARRDAQAIAAASDHTFATAMLLKHCGLKSGDWALEYGAGFGQTALTLARLGVNVDTVDISATFCGFIQKQAEHFGVPLTPFHGAFDLQPRLGQRYQLIWFYESFHHCTDFARVVHQLKEMLDDSGRVILAGEPIADDRCPAMPYPWGMRLHAEVAAVVRNHHWFELGFSEAFLYQLFVNAGFVGERIDCAQSELGRLYVFSRRPEQVEPLRQWLPVSLARGLHAPPVPRAGWVVSSPSHWPVDATASFEAIEIGMTNNGSSDCEVSVHYGGSHETVVLGASRSASLRFAASPGARRLKFATRPIGSGRWFRLPSSRASQSWCVVLDSVRYS